MKASPLVRRLIGESAVPDYVTNFEKVSAYLSAIRPKLDEARDAAAQGRPEQRDLILKGHGSYMGSCGHKIQGCRCAHNIDHIKVGAPCRECAERG